MAITSITEDHSTQESSAVDAEPSQAQAVNAEREMSRDEVIEFFSRLHGIDPAGRCYH